MARRRKGGPGQKGTFGEPELPVARSYLVPGRRNRALAAALVVALVLVAVAAVNYVFFGGRWLSQGPLSSAHVGFAEDCGNCHSEADRTLGRTVTDEKCAACHEKLGDELGVYSFVAHYLYRSDDFRRLVPSEHEMPCFSCHVEHEGREAEITRVPDRRCVVCHEMGSFNSGHPEFDFAAEGIPDSSSLAFPHLHHVNQVIERQQLEDPQRACLYCHNARPDGLSFEPIDFDRHCDTCHLTTTIRTPALPLESADTAGVETLESIVARGGPGLRWALFANPNEFRRRGSSVVKGPLHHADPWILENLRQLRRRLYPDAGLADLLTTSADVPAADLRVLYEEAIANLEEQAAALRNRPEPQIQAELATLDAMLQRLRRALDDPYVPLDETRFALALDRPDPSLSSAEVTEIETLIADLTEPCRECHRVQNATIARVRADQRTLVRAEFNHRAHIVQLRCTDCHNEIPILENVGVRDKLEPEVDNAAIHNLPRIATCRECHSERGASNRCVTCHYQHPNKSRRSELLLYLDDAP